MRVDSAKYLFDPDAVLSSGSDLPHLVAALGAVGREGGASEAFPGARKSYRQIYRVLSNAQYPHVLLLLESLDACLGGGFEQPTLMRTRGRAEFVSGVSELLVGDYLRRRDFVVEGLEDHKGSESIPELIARRKDLDIAVEVYTPRQWPGLDELTEELKDGLENADIPFDFEYRLSIDPLERVDQQGRLRFSNPVEIARHLQPHKRTEMVGPMLEEVLGRLVGGAEETGAVRVESDLNLSVSIEIEGACASGARLPERPGVISPLAVNGYSPEGMFAQVVERVRRKAMRSQAPQAHQAATSILIVDLTYAELTSELWCGYYSANFEETIRKRLSRPVGGYDLIAFCSWQSTAAAPRMHFAVSDDRRLELAGVLFEVGPEPTAGW